MKKGFTILKWTNCKCPWPSHYAGCPEGVEPGTGFPARLGQEFKKSVLSNEWSMPAIGFEGDGELEWKSGDRDAAIQKLMKFLERLAPRFIGQKLHLDEEGRCLIYQNYFANVYLETAQHSQDEGLTRLANGKRGLDVSIKIELWEDIHNTTLSK